MAETAYFGESLKSGSGLLATADLSANQFYAVTIGSSGVSLVAAQGVADVKLLTNKPLSGEVCALIDIGETKAIAGGTIAKGDLVMTDATGKFIKFVDANGQVPVGEARMPAASGDVFTIFLFPHAVRGNGTASGDLTAAGTTRADALALTAMMNQIATAGAGTGVVLPAAVLGMRVWIGNAGANTLAVYAAGADTINGTAGATGVTMATTKNAEFFCGSAGKWRMILTA